MPGFFDFIRGGSANNGAPVAGDLPTEGARGSDVRSIFSALSDTAVGVAGVVNAFRGTGDRQNNARPVAAVNANGTFQRWLPFIAIGVGALVLWLVLRKR